MPFDDEGFSLTPVTYVNQGVIEALRCGRYLAKEHGRRATGDLSELVMSPGTAASRDELIKGVKHGVLITRVWYTNFTDPKALMLTGLPRDGTFLIENGASCWPRFQKQFELRSSMRARPVEHQGARPLSSTSPRACR